MTWFYCLVAAFGMGDKGASEATDWMKPATWTGSYWGPEATSARKSGELPPLASTPTMSRYAAWGRTVLRDGDVVFRLGDAKAFSGTFPLSRFIAAATGSRFSHTGIVAVEDGVPVIYDSSSDGVQRQPFEVWMLDCVGAVGVKRPRPEFQAVVPGVLAYCRRKFEEHVPFDFEFRLGDDAFYCVELTERAFRSQGVKLSEPIKIGDWEHLDRYPMTAVTTPFASKLLIKDPISLEQPVYVPGNDRTGVWASPVLQTVYEGDTNATPIVLKTDGDLIYYAVAAFRARVDAIAAIPVPTTKK